MTTDVQRRSELPPLTRLEELEATFHAASKPVERFRIGLEHEKIGVLLDSGLPVPYDGERSIVAIFNRMIKDYGWEPVYDSGILLALSRGAGKVTLEPGGQIELSGAAHKDLAGVRAEFEEHFRELGAVSDDLGIAWLGVGARPCHSMDEIPFVPKPRYGIMWDYLATKGSMGREMMKRTATIQANMDWSDEADAIAKFRTGMATQAIVTALCANSPIVGGKDTGLQSYRAKIWLDTDPDRCGVPSFSFDDTGLFRNYAAWAADVPLFFAKTSAGYETAGGMTFRQYMERGFKGQKPTLDDWELHLSTLFPDVRLKGYLEVRGSDSGTMEMVVALTALWRGLLYDAQACDEAWQLCKAWSYEERMQLVRGVPKDGLRMALPGGKGTVQDVAREVVAIAKRGLSRLEPSEQSGLAMLEEIATTGVSPADKVRAIWERVGGCSIKLSNALRYH